MGKTESKAEEKEKWFSPAQISEDLEISRSKVQLELTTGLVHYRFGRLIKVRQSDLARWLESKKVKA